MKPTEETQIGPKREIRFKVDPPGVPGEKLIVEMGDGYLIAVECEGLGENGYAKGRILGRWRALQQSTASEKS